MKKIYLLIIIEIFIVYGVFAQKYDYYYKKGQLNFDSGNYKLAISYYDSSISKNTKHANSYFNRGLCLGMLDDTIASLNDFVKYLELVPNDPDAYERIGYLKKELKDTSGAIRSFDSCLKYDPSNYDVRISRGKLYWMIDSLLKSHEDFDYAYHLDTSKVEGIYFKGVSHYMLEQYDSALKYLSLSFINDTNYINALYYKAYSNYEKKEFDRALADANILIGKEPKDPDYLILRALIYLFNNSEYDDDLAEDDLYEALKLGSEKARKLLDEYFSDEGEDN